ncbi:hypothetical protein EJ03DRAFT_344956 [Teratosphaeria nubilosa]|uniref:Thioesterase/thiol ester dehydrase-isomerase n=1 Tax=Teratosphaeria nubilosa TaxID=161662 RepID=A0A6G1L275_9PEZI|nr:hypothetical protein EJ03DRAFT_344956 [Teratosphaeria nubilosa]
MKTRLIPPIFDDLTPNPSHRLTLTLADFLPSTTTRTPTLLPPSSPKTPLPIPHHLLYFEPTKPSSAMLPDGTNPDQSPGAPFVRRMWAGGRVLYNAAHPLTLDGGRGVCAEFIRSVTGKGKEGEEKLFVGIERRIARVTGEEMAQLALAAAKEGWSLAQETLEHRVRQRLWRDEETDFGPASIVETRNIVFMRARSAAEAALETAKAGSKKLSPSHAPDWTHTIVPDAKLLFRFSALTFNAHAIHLDPEYCRGVEQHREKLFHGPLSYVFMVTLLQRVLERERSGERVARVEYRNLAPLYAGERVTFCGTRVGEGRWEVWTQTPEGGVAVKGTVVTERGGGWE